MNKLDMESKNIINENVEKIKLLFPNCVVENQINFEMLKQELSSNVIDDMKEKYQLTWPGKKQSVLTANTPTTKTLRPIIEKSVDYENTENIYIEGDNLEVLKILQESYLNKIKCIYIDPPYNTGNDFIYNDNFFKNKVEELNESGQSDSNGNRLISNSDSNGRFHSDWISMMYSRIKLARNLLSNEGIIFISIDDNEYVNLKKICDEIFGENNNISTFIWQKKSSGGQHANFVLDFHEYILCYAKNISNISELTVQRTDEQLDSFKLEDEYVETRGKYLLSPLKSWLDYRRTLIYDIECPDGTKLNTQWICSEQTFKELKADGRIVFKQNTNGEWSIYKKQYSKENGGRVKPASIINNHGQTSTGKRDIKELFDFDALSFPKPVELIKYLISMLNDKNMTIMDFFSGSGTTAQSIMKLNSEDNGKRKFIMIQLPELIDETNESFKKGYKTICEIGEERIRKSAKKIKEETNANIDYGFRVYKVDSSNMKDNFYKKPNELEQGQLNLFETNIKEDRTSEDLLTQVLLDLGLTLDLKIEEKKLNNNNVYFVEDNSLIACFDDELDFSIIDEIANSKPLKVVFKDSSFKNDNDKINLEEKFKKLSPETEVSVL